MACVQTRLWTACWPDADDRFRRFSLISVRLGEGRPTSRQRSLSLGRGNASSCPFPVIATGTEQRRGRVENRRSVLPSCRLRCARAIEIEPARSTQSGPSVVRCGSDYNSIFRAHDCTCEELRGRTVSRVRRGVSLWLSAARQTG
jgi:hypothetical protein